MLTIKVDWCKSPRREHEKKRGGVHAPVAEVLVFCERACVRDVACARPVLKQRNTELQRLSILLREVLPVRWQPRRILHVVRGEVLQGFPSQRPVLTIWPEVARFDLALPARKHRSEAAE